MSELCEVVQLPQSTVSRHLKTLLDGGWVSSRREGTNRFYGIASDELSGGARRVWNVLREELAGTRAAEQDERRLKRVLAERRTTSQEFFSSAAGQWDRLREELFGRSSHLRALGRAARPGLGRRGPRVRDRPGRGGRRAVRAARRSPWTVRARCCRRRRRGCVATRTWNCGGARLERLPLDDASLDAAIDRAGAASRARPRQGVCRGRPRRSSRAAASSSWTCCRTSTTSIGRRWGTSGWGSTRRSSSACWAPPGFDAVRVHALEPEPGVRGPALFVASGVRSVRARREAVERADVEDAGLAVPAMSR